MRAGARLAARDPATSAAAPTAAVAAPPSSFRGLSDLLGYRPVRQIAATAGMQVWESERSGRRYALKLPADGAGPGARAALGAEFTLGRALDHPAIVRPCRWLDDNGLAAIVFDYFSGGDLVSLAGAPVARWARPLLDVLAALDYLHTLGIAHRDVKARNVLLDEDDRARLIDLGSCLPFGSRWSADGTTAGHRPAPARAIVSAADDLYAFARLVEEMLRPDRRSQGRRGADAESRLAALVAASIERPDEAPREKLRDFGHVLESALGTSGRDEQAPLGGGDRVGSNERKPGTGSE